MVWSWRAPPLREPFDPNRETDRGDRAGAAEPREQTIVAPAGNQLAGRLRARVIKFEHEAGVVVEAAAERGGEADAADVDAARGKKAGAALEQVERGVERDVGLAGEGTQVRRSLIGIAADREELLDQGAGLARQRGLGAKRRLLQKAVGDLIHRASAYGGDARNREQVGDQRMGCIGI